MRALDKKEITETVIEFYRKADAGVRCVELLPYIDESMHMFWSPNCIFDGHVGFEEFYDNLRRATFDRKHVVSDIQIDLRNDLATVSFLIHLTARVWWPPAPKSYPVDNHAGFTWIMKMSPKTERPVITSYTCTRVEFAEGSTVMNADVVFKDPQPMWGPFVFPPPGQ